jgi:hypothetical protein
MLTTRTHRLDPSLIPEEQLVEVAKAFAKPDHVMLIDSQGNQTHIPEALFAHFARIIRLMSERKAIVMLPEDEAFTTQAAANYLGMSRQFFVNLLEKGGDPASPRGHAPACHLQRSAGIQTEAGPDAT